MKSYSVTWVDYVLIDCTRPGVKGYMRKADLMPDLVDQVLGDLARGVARFLASRDLWHFLR
jgi:hypothetical protein